MRTEPEGGVHTVAIPISHDPEAMSTRARIILIAEATVMSLIGITILAYPNLYQSVAWVYIDTTPGLAFWGVAFSFAGALNAVAAILRNPDVARWALIAAGVCQVTVCAGITSAFFRELNGAKEFSPLIPLLLMLLVVMSFAMAAQPIRTPFELLLRQFRVRQAE